MAFLQKMPRPREAAGAEVRRKKITRPSGSHILTDTDNKKSPAAEDGASAGHSVLRTSLETVRRLTDQLAGGRSPRSRAAPSRHLCNSSTVSRSAASTGFAGGQPRPPYFSLRFRQNLYIRSALARDFALWVYFAQGRSVGNWMISAVMISVPNRGPLEVGVPRDI